MNKVMILGNLGADPTFKVTSSNQSVAELRVATSERWTDATTKEKKEHTEWHRVVVWGKQAQSCKEYLSKGDKVLVEGKIQTRKWTDNNNIERYTTEIRADHVEFVTTKGNAQRQQSGGYNENYDNPPSGEAPVDDDIPF